MGFCGVISSWRWLSRCRFFPHFDSFFVMPWTFLSFFQFFSSFFVGFFFNFFPSFLKFIRQHSRNLATEKLSAMQKSCAVWGNRYVWERGNYCSPYLSLALKLIHWEHWINLRPERSEDCFWQFVPVMLDLVRVFGQQPTWTASQRQGRQTWQVPQEQPASPWEGGTQEIREESLS